MIFIRYIFLIRVYKGLQTSLIKKSINGYHEIKAINKM